MDRSGEQHRTQLKTTVASIWERALPRVREQIDVIERAVVGLLEDRPDAELLREAERAAHRLAGSCGSFGYRESSAYARELELMFHGESEPDARRAAELVLALRRQVDPDVPAASTDPPLADTATPAGDDVLIVTADADLARDVIHALRVHALPARHAADVEAARAAAASARPAVFIMDAAAGAEHHLELLEALGGGNGDVAAIVISERGSFIDRVEAVRHGARAFLQKPIPAADIAAAAADVLTRARPVRARVLAVDDDEVLLAVIASVLRDAGYDVHTQSDPRDFWRTLQDVQPDVLLLDQDMPHANGVELCRMVRSDLRWRSLPVIFITAATDPDMVSAAFDAGADDFIRKPIVPRELTARVRNRLERLQLLRQLTDTDPLTGLATRRRSEDKLADYQRLAERYSQPFCIALVDLDAFRNVNREFGHAAGDDALRAVAALMRNAFRGEDVVARWAGEEFMIGMYGMHRDDAVHRLGELQEKLRAQPLVTDGSAHPRLSFSAGIAEYGRDGRDIQSLIRSADTHLQLAKEQGKARVVAAEPAAERAMDVLVVEDDDTLAELLMHALETRGYHATRIADGQAAVAALAGENAYLRPRVVLLDVDLPGMDGISVLRAWKQAGVLGYTRVVMLTVRSGEREVMETLRLDAYDHVAKPFSIPVLMQRVRRALQP